MDHSATILHMGFVTHDVKQFILTRPQGLEFQPGQGVEIAVDADGWKDQGRPFTPTSPVDGPVLEFHIKVYPQHDAVTEALHVLHPGDGLLLSDAFGTITYHGPGTFIAAGAGVTPFLTILRHIEDPGELKRCTLLFSNDTPADVIREKELRYLLGDRCHLTCTRVTAPGYDHGRIGLSYLKEKVDQLDRPIYVCGPPGFVTDMREAVMELGADPVHIIVEE